MERSRVLRILYEHIEDKSKIMTRRAVTTIEHSARGIKVKTATGDVFEGDLVIGADGIHSVVRREMWRIADIEQPGLISTAERDSEFG